MNSIESGASRESGGRKLYPAVDAAAAESQGEQAGHPSFSDIAIRRMTFLGGPNMWTYRPVIEAIIDLGALEDYPSNKLPGFVDRLLAWLPSLVEHRCSVGERGGFIERLREGTWAGHILEHVTLELQTLAGMKSGFGRTRETHQRGVYKLVFRTDHPAVGRPALERGRDLLMAAINGHSFDVNAAVKALTVLVDRYALGPSTLCIVEAARKRGIPATRLNDGNLVQLGYGRSQRRIWTAETDQTSAIADEISRDKDLTKRLLAEAGVPVPEGETVETADAAWEAAEDIGLPVVVKPSDGNHARGVSLNLKTREQVANAFAAAEREGSGVIVERYIEGDEHRLLVVGDKVVAATRGEVVSVRGDGKSTIADLIAIQINTDPRRGNAETFPLEPLRADDPVLTLILQSQHLTSASVLAADQMATVQRTGNMDIDVTGEVHPLVAARATLAARTVGLDIAGIDLVAQDIGRPLETQGGAVVEVNAGPGLLMHLKPAHGKPEPVGEAIAAHLFPAGDSGRIPVVGIVDGAQDALTARLLNDLLLLHGWRTGLACRTGTSLGARQLNAVDATGFDTAQAVLINRTVQAAVIATSARRILAEGLPYDRCQIGIVVAMPAAQGLEDLFITRAEQMPGVIRTQVDVVLPGGAAILNADDAGVLALAEYCDGEVILFGTQPERDALVAHRAAGGRAVLARHGHIILASGAQEEVLVELSNAALLQATPAGPQDLRPQVLAATAAAWSLGVAPRLIHAGLLHFNEGSADC